MPRNLLGIIVIVFIIGVNVNGRYVVKKNRIRILYAYGIMSEKHDAAIADFGLPLDGGAMVGSVMYPHKNSYACKPFDGVDKDKLPFRSNSTRPIILLVDRGKCFFTLKVYNGMQAGAAAVLVADDINEPLITLEYPEEGFYTNYYIDKIGIPSALIHRAFGETLKAAVQKGKEDVVLKLYWSDLTANSDQRVEYEFRTYSNDECGFRCDEQMNFVKDFKGHAQILEKGGHTMFTPHYKTWFCPPHLIQSHRCKSQCINHGRYCALDPEKNLGEGYQGKDVVLENLRQLCVHRVASVRNRSWVWWDFVTDFHIRCSIKAVRFSKECAEDVLISLDLPIEKIKGCMGDPEADVENDVLKLDQDRQVEPTSRGDVTILPTLFINDVQYRGKLERIDVLKAICSGFQQTTNPPICLNADIETSQCLERNGGCWQDSESNITACKDTYRGRVCECPVVNGVQYKGDGYMSCEAEINSTKSGWLLAFVRAAFAATKFYKYRFQSYMDSEVIDIMSKYMQHTSKSFNMKTGPYDKAEGVYDKPVTLQKPAETRTHL